MGELFYTGEQKERLKSISEDANARRRPLSEAMGAAILDALGGVTEYHDGYIGQSKKLRWYVGR